MKNPNGYEKPANRLPFLVEKRPLPGTGIATKKHPDKAAYGSDWEWIMRAVGGEAPHWHRVHRDAPNRQAAGDINRGRNRYIDPEVFQAAAIKTQSDPDLYDVYLRVIPPQESECPIVGSGAHWERVEEAQEWARAQRERIALMRQAWREKWQLEWTHEERRRAAQESPDD